MIVQQFFVKSIAHSSYLLGSSKTCAIIDPSRDVDIYLDAARSLGLKITHILETHLHADFVSGHLDLKEKTGAQIYAPRGGNCSFEHVPIAEGDTILIEDVMLKVLETPGHTPEHISYVAIDTTRGDQPAAVFCGDTLFVGDVGRPDLFPGMAEELASSLYDSLYHKLLGLPDFCEVYPAHGAGSLCGKSIGAKRTSTIGYERKYNYALQAAGRKEFIELITNDMPPAPDHFTRLSAVNAGGPALVGKMPQPRPLAPRDFNKARQDGAVVLDIRSYDSFGGQHIPGAYNIDYWSNFATFAGWIIPPDRDILLVGHSAQQVRDSLVWLRRVGLDRTTGFLAGGMLEWANAGLEVDHVRHIPAVELHRLAVGDSELTLVDVRSSREFAAGHIQGAVNIPVPDIRTEYGRLDRNKPVVVMCSVGQRASLASSILKMHGFTEVLNVAGGMTGYNAAGFAPECPVCAAPHTPALRAI